MKIFVDSPYSLEYSFRPTNMLQAYAIRDISEKYKIKQHFKRGLRDFKCGDFYFIINVISQDIRVVHSISYIGDVDKYCTLVPYFTVFLRVLTLCK